MTDLIIIIIVLYGGYFGYQKGLISQLFRFMILFICIYKGIDIFQYFSEIFIKKENKLLFTGISIIISFFFIIFIAFLMKKIIELIFIFTWMNPLNKWLGGLLGLIKYFLFISICLCLIKEVNKKIYLFTPNFFKNSFEQEFQNLSYVYIKFCLFFLKKLKEFLPSNII
ncbi:CvpA family protein [Blattabacterium cuenoti]|uniref:CvpA family protein n=1 Tax=Blattabacterium cuenoti TaxID=1653831 RepID=UPI001EE9E6EE|nr:CvpA family protein [Blattabacterium cuenoti]